MTEHVAAPQARQPRAVPEGSRVPRRRRRWPWATAAGAVVVLAAGVCAVVVSTTARSDDGIQRLAARDPAGARACSQLRDWFHGKLINPVTGKNANQLTAATRIAGAAAIASTPRIRSAGDDIMVGSLGDTAQPSSDPASLRVADLQQMHRACVAAGVDLPDWAQHPA